MNDRILDYHNNDLVADLDHFLKDPITQLYTDWEILCRVAQIVAKRKAPSIEMTDCQTGLHYGDFKHMNDNYEKALSIARRNAGQ